MKIKLLAGLLCLVMLASVGCGNDPAVESDTETDPPKQTETDRNQDAESESESESESETEADAPETEANTETDTETETEKETETMTDKETQIESETETQTATESATTTDKVVESETEDNYDSLAHFTNLSIDQLVPGVTSTTAELKKMTYKISKTNADKIRLLGRAQLLKSNMLCDHSAAGFEVQGFMTGDVVLTATSTGDTYYTVYIDGVRVEQRFYVGNRKLSMVIATFEGNNFHTIKVLKQSESAWSTSYVDSLAFKGVLLEKPQARKLTIEVLGDSLTTGYGNLGVKSEGNAEGGNTPHKQDATQSYGFLAAEKLNADCNIMAWSGVGLDIGWTHAPFDTYYERQNFHRESKVTYNYDLNAPDVLIVHLGANDFTYERDKDSAATSKFVEKGIKLVEDIRKGYGKDMPVIWAYDPDEGVPEYIKQISDHFGGEANGFYIIELEWQSTDEYWGASGHPSVAAHEKHAQMIVDLIEEKQILK